MAQGGYSAALDEEESEDIDDVFMLPYLNPALTFYKNQADEKFRAKMYEEASVLYTAAMEQPVIPFMDMISIICEELFRKRAECFFKMGNYLDAIKDSERAIQVADDTNNPNLAKSVFIKAKAIIYREDYPPAFPFALWCKHLRPNCQKSRATLNDLKEKLTEEFKKDESVIDEVLFRMLPFAEEMRMDPDNLELALECYTELLDLIDFRVLPEVQLRQAECLLQLERCNEAKVACAKVLLHVEDDVDALSLMGKITQQISEREMRQVKEREKLDGVKAEPLRIEMNDSTVQQPFQPKRQTVQREKESPLYFVPNVVREKKKDLDQEQVEGVTAKEQGNNQRRRKGNTEKRKKKKAKKKVKKKSESSLKDLPPVSNDPNGTSDESLDDVYSQVTDSFIEHSQIGSGYFNTVLLSSTLNVIEVDGYEVSDREEFIHVPNTRRPPSSPLQGCQQMFPEKVFCVDRIVQSDENRQSSVLAASQQPNSQTMKEMSHITERQSLTYVRATSSAITPVTTANKKTSGLTSHTIVASQEQTTFASVASRNLVCDMKRRQNEKEILTDSAEFPALERRSLQVSASSSDAAWSNLKAAHRPSNELILVGVNSDRSLRINPARPDNSVSFTSSTPEQWQKITTPAPIIQGLQGIGIGNATITHADQLIGLGNRVPIPEKVSVVCVHFLSKRPMCDYVQAKTCQWCEDRSLLNYAVWNDLHRFWQVIRPFPVDKIPLSAPLNVCRHFAAKTSCRKEPCTYAHGDIEKHLWEKQREGSLHTPKESLRLLRSINATARTQVITQERDTGSLPLQTTVTRTECVTMASFTTSSVNECPGFDAVVTQSTTRSLLQVQSSKPSTFSHIRATPVISAPKAVPSGSIPYQSPREANSKGKTSSTSSLDEKIENPIAPIETFVKPSDMTSKVKREGVVLSDTLRAEVSNLSTWSSSLDNNETISIPIPSSAQEDIQSGILSQSTASERSTNSQSTTWSNVLKAPGKPSKETNDTPSKNSCKDYRKVPTGVYVVCDHFLKENLTRAVSVSPKAKPCKGCENRSKFKYAFWSVTWKRWEEIRPYPKDWNIKSAFKKCRQCSKHNRCRNISCSYAHGEQELTMWTMEREGSK